MTEAGLDIFNRRVVAEALSWVGTPYRHQGGLKGVGCDCIGLIRGVWAAISGKEAPATGFYSRDWAEAGADERLLDAFSQYFEEFPGVEISAGHVIAFRWRPHLPAKHAGIMVEDGRFVHAYEGHAVMASALVPQWRRRIAAVYSFPENREA